MGEKQYPDGKDVAQTLTSQVITSSDRLPPPPLTSEGATSGAVWVRDTEKKKTLLLYGNICKDIHLLI